MEEHAFKKLSIDRNPDFMSMYDTALKRNLRMLLVVASASMRELRIPLNFLSLKMFCRV